MTDVPPPPQDLPPTSPTEPPKGPVYTGPPATPDDRTMGMLCHLLGILLGFLGPLIIWLMKKDTSPFVNDQGKEALNFQITLLIGYVIGGATMFVCVGFILTPLVWLAGVVFGIMGAMAANKGEVYRYPFTLRLIN